MGAWVRMNGSSGCMPDSIDAHEDKAAAILAAVDLFADTLDDRSNNNMVMDLRTDGIHYFAHPRDAGADYVSVEYLDDVEPEDYDDDTPDNSCNQCVAAMINGHYCHETGCPNTHKVKVDGEWITPEPDDES